MKRILSMLAAGALVVTASATAPASATMRGPAAVNSSGIVQIDHRRWDNDGYTNWKPRHHRRHARHHWRRHHEPRFGFFFDFGGPRHYDRYDRRYRYDYYDRW